MAVRVEPLVLLASVAFHAGLAVAVVRVEPREAPPPPPVVITVREVEPEPPPQPKPEVPEPEPEQPEPEPVEPELETPEPADPEPQPSARPEPAPPEPAPAEPAPAEPAPPDFGLELGGASGPGGLDVPQGDPNGKPGSGGGPKKKVAAQTRKLSSPEPAEHESGCQEEASKPKPLKLDKPTYTEAARAAAIEGAVRLKISVASDGSVEAVEVLQALDPELDARAVAAAKLGSFEPARRCGEAVAASLTVSIRFSL